MINHRFMVRKAAVLGAGVMGAQIAAHLVNANIETLLFELPDESRATPAHPQPRQSKTQKARARPLSLAAKAACIQPVNYDQHLGLLTDCDLVIEAIAERIDWKTELYLKIAPHLGNIRSLPAILWLSINQLVQALPEELRHRFCGIHFLIRHVICI